MWCGLLAVLQSLQSHGIVRKVKSEAFYKKKTATLRAKNEARSPQQVSRMVRSYAARHQFNPFPWSHGALLSFWEAKKAVKLSADEMKAWDVACH